MSPETLTTIVYVIILLTFVAAIAWVVVYSRRQSALLKQAVRDGARPHSVAEGLIIAQEMGKRGKR
jgi:hypothetical protein